VLPAGDISPKAARAVRDVLRQRAHVVRQQTATVLRRHNIIVRNTGGRLRAKRIHALPREDIGRLLPEPEPSLAVTSRLAVVHCLEPPMQTVEKLVHTRLKHSPAYAQLQTVEGIGTIVAQTIVLATGAMRRFATVGQYASSCRGVQSTTSSHGKRQGQGHVKNGHPYLAWASREATQFALRFRPTGQRFYHRQQAKSPLMVARKAVAHPLARACSDIMRDLMPFAVHQALG
jgi:transposase